MGSTHKVLQKVFIMLTLHNLLLSNGFKLDTRLGRFLAGLTRKKPVFYPTFAPCRVFFRQGRGFARFRPGSPEKGVFSVF